jgi:predicted Zn-dependent protease
MAMSKYWALLWVFALAHASSLAAATPAECQAAASQPALTSALARVARNPDDLGAKFALADAWSDAGCYNDAVNVLENAASSHPQNAELQTRLRAAKTLLGNAQPSRTARPAPKSPAPGGYSNASPPAQSH